MADRNIILFRNLLLLTLLHLFQVPQLPHYVDYSYLNQLSNIPFQNNVNYHQHHNIVFVCAVYIYINQIFFIIKLSIIIFLNYLIQL